MKKILLALSIIFLLTVPAALSAEFDSEKVRTMINTNVEKISALKTVVGSERINVEILMNDGSANIVGIVTKDGIVQELKNGGISDPTLSMQLSEDALAKANSNPGEMVKMLNNGGIKFQPQSLLMKVKVFFINIVLKVLSFFQPSKPTGNFISNIHTY